MSSEPNGVDCTPAFAPEGESCDDEDPETQNDQCDGQGACSGSVYSCPGVTTCTTDYTKDGEGCLPSHAPSGTPCDDGNAETAQDQCDGAGLCVGSPFDCPPVSACTPSYAKDGDTCVAQYAAEGVACDDGELSTKEDVCNGAGQCFGTTYSCPALTQCVTDYVQDGADCVATYVASGSPCDDGDPTTQMDMCDGAGGCSGATYECPNASPCTPSYTQDGESCLPNHAPLDTPCDDADVSTQGDQCDGEGGCAGSPYTCPEESVCTPSYTQDGSGCVAEYAESGTLCDDGDVTTQDDQCNGAGTCLGTTYSCPATSTCTPEFVQDGTSCVAQHAVQGTSCDDGNLTTQGDTCDGSGGCAGTPYTCPGASACTLSYTQDGATCVPNYAPVGTQCDDAKVTTKDDACDTAGVCVGAEYSCPASTLCTPSHIQDGSGCVPTYAQSGTACNDGNNDTNNDQCNASGSCLGSFYSCPGGTTCTPSYTKDGSGCVPNYAGGGTPCTDGSTETNHDQCNGAGSCSGSFYSCPGGTTCTPSYIKDGSGCLPNYAGGGTPCTDGSNDTNNDQCNGSGTCSGSFYSCPGTSTCTPSYTKNGSICIPNHAGSGSPCSDGSNDTNNDQCNGSGSCAGSFYSCPGGTTCTPSYTKNGSSCVPNYAGSGTACNDGDSSTSNDQCNGSGTCTGAACQAPQPEVVSDGLAYYENDMVLVFANGEVIWGVDLFILDVFPIAASINAIYQSVLGRPADQSGLNYWVSDYLNQCDADPACDPGAAKTFVNATHLSTVENAIVYSYSVGDAAKGSVTVYSYCEAKAAGY